MRVVPGLLFIARLSGLLADIFPDGTIARELNAKSSAPAYENETVTILVTIKSYKLVGAHYLYNFTFRITNTEGHVVISGKSSALVPVN